MPNDAITPFILAVPKSGCEKCRIRRALCTWILGNAERLAMPRNLDVSLPENTPQPEWNFTQ